MSEYWEDKQKVEVVEECDICVIGGSCTGVFAAVRASRMGAKVCIIENNGFFGGVATAGLVNVWHSLLDTNFDKSVIGGLTKEVIERLKYRNAVNELSNRPHVGFYLNTEELKIELDELIKESNVRPFLHARFCSPIKDGEKLIGITIEDKSGRRGIKAKYFIDASGDADLVHRLGWTTHKDDAIQPPTLCAKISGIGKIQELNKDFNLSNAVFDPKYQESIDRGVLWTGKIPNAPDVTMVAGTRCHGVDVSNADELTLAEIEGRKQVRKICDLMRNNFEGGKDIALLSLPTYIGSRESRHADCIYKLNGEDILYGNRFDDAIGNGTYCSDIHFPDKSGLIFRYLDGREVTHQDGKRTEGRWRDESLEDPGFYQIPYRSLVPSQSRNVLVAGRSLDADAMAFGAVRVMVNCNQMGEAVGVASAIALKDSCSVQDIDINELRESLTYGGSEII
ncbi:MAG: FAD-dependent oxidoreductase [Planctomycetota bacterium]|nr:MAG: FAD-dependent oxidoreductase [Planctomycetota bacterium]